ECILIGINVMTIGYRPRSGNIGLAIKESTIDVSKTFVITERTISYAFGKLCTLRLFRCALVNTQTEVHFSEETILELIITISGPCERITAVAVGVIVEGASCPA